MNYSTQAQNQIAKIKQIPVRQPIAQLPSFAVLTEVFSYYGLNEDVVDLLHKLSRKFNKYIKSGHRQMLMNACIAVSRTKVPASMPFEGNKDICKPFSCILRGGQSAGLRLCEIRVSLDGVLSMTSLQMVMINDETKEQY